MEGINASCGRTYLRRTTRRGEAPLAKKSKTWGCPSGEEEQNVERAHLRRTARRIIMGAYVVGRSSKLRFSAPLLHILIDAKYFLPEQIQTEQALDLVPTSLGRGALLTRTNSDRSSLGREEGGAAAAGKCSFEAIV